MTEDAFLNANFRAQWTMDPTIQAGYANQMLIEPGAPTASGNGGPEGVYVTFGHMNPPIFNLPPGTAPTQEMVDGMVLPIVPIARLFVTIDRLRDFAAIIQGSIDALAANEAAEQ